MTQNTKATKKMGSKSTPLQNLHIALFPFMSKGHTIPLLHLTKLIHNHRPHATFTIFTTPANEPFISASISSLSPNNFTILPLPFSTTNDDIPQGVESTDQLPSMSLFHSFAFATVSLKPQFETTLENIQKGQNPLTFLISDGFLYWTQESASKFNIPRLVFYGMNVFSPTILRVAVKNRVISQVPEFPWIKLRKYDFGSLFVTDPQHPDSDFRAKARKATSMSYAMVVNSFYELEQPFVDYWSSQIHPKCWCVGPFCLVDKPTLESLEKPDWIKWLDNKKGNGIGVLYIAFGSQAEISNDQLKEIQIGLENSGVNFLWVLRIKSNQTEVMQGFEERVKDHGLVVKSWVNQTEILEHKSIRGFLSHCGWNSTMESICAGIPILAWPMIAEQHLNAKMVVDEIKVGLRVDTCDESTGFVKGEDLSKVVKLLMEGEMGKRMTKNMEKLSKVAKKSVEEGGSSWCNLETLLNELEMRQKALKETENSI